MFKNFKKLKNTIVEFVKSNPNCTTKQIKRHLEKTDHAGVLSGPKLRYFIRKYLLEKINVKREIRCNLRYEAKRI